MFYLNKKTIITLFVVLAFLFFPFDVDRIVYQNSDIEITFYKAITYTFVCADIYGLKRSECCFFPSNFDMNNNIKILTGEYVPVSHPFDDLYDFITKELP